MNELRARPRWERSIEATWIGEQPTIRELEHIRTMQAVGRFWAQLENVRPPMPEPEYLCEMVGNPPLESIYSQLVDASRINPEFAPAPLNLMDFMRDMYALHRRRKLLSLSEHRNNYFTVIFPQDDRINLFRALAEPSMDGRNLSWYAYKRGIDTKRIRNIHWEDGHMVMDIMLQENDDESQSRHDALCLNGDASVHVIRGFDACQDPTSFACAPGVQVVEMLPNEGGEQQPVPIGQ